MSKATLVNNVAKESQGTQWISQLTSSSDTGTIDRVLREWGDMPFSGGHQIHLSGGYKCGATQGEQNGQMDAGFLHSSLEMFILNVIPVLRRRSRSCSTKVLKMSFFSLNSPERRKVKELLREESMISLHTSSCGSYCSCSHTQHTHTPRT